MASRSPAPARLALVGAGRMGRMHLRALARSAPGSPDPAPGHGVGVEVVAVVDPVEAVREELGHAGYRVHPRLEDLLEQAAHGEAELPDGVLVAAPTDRHAEVVRVALAAGLPVLCEKPAGLTAAEVARTGQLAARSGVPLQVAYWRRFIPELVALRERIAAGRLGEVLHLVCAQWDEAPPAPGFRHSSGGIFVDMGVHEFDQLRWLTGQEIVDVASASTPAVDPQARPDRDGGQALLSLSGGATAVVSLGRHFAGGDWVSVEVFGTRGHERVTVLDQRSGELPQLRALARQAEAFAGAISTGRRTGAGIADAVAALDAAARCR